jgi:hypothetical protein
MKRIDGDYLRRHHSSSFPTHGALPGIQTIDDRSRPLKSASQLEHFDSEKKVVMQARISFSDAGLADHKCGFVVPDQVFKLKLVNQP